MYYPCAYAFKHLAAIAPIGRAGAAPSQTTQIAPQFPNTRKPLQVKSSPNSRKQRKQSKRHHAQAPQ